MRVSIRAAVMAAVMGMFAPGAQGVGLAAVSTNAALRGERVIQDPYLGRCWVLKKDPEHPGGPGKLIEEHAGTAVEPSGANKEVPVIRAGDRVLVEENTRVARGLFEAVALSAAKEGSTFRVRLTVGRRVVRAIAMGPGRAVLAGADEVGQ